MSDRYKGAILSPTAPTVTPQSAGGIYTSSQQLQYQGQGVWPTAFNNPINNSLRFRASASAFLNRTPASAGNRRTWTYSVWVKRGALGGNITLLDAGRPNNPWTAFYFSDGDGVAGLNTLAFATTAGTQPGTHTNATFRDVSAWYHFVLAVDTTQATAADRVKIWVNNVAQTFSYTNYPSQNYDTYVNSTTSHSIGALSNGGASNHFDGYMTEINLIDGAALTPSSFGTTDAYGIWQPIPYTGAYGTNGFYLPFTDNSALTTSSNVGLGKDFSGNGNYWTTNGISITAGSTYDSMKDVPTNTNSNTANYCVMNPLNLPKGGTLSNGNLLWTAPSAEGQAVGTMYASSGKFYWEMVLNTAGAGCAFGIASITTDINNINLTAGSYVYYTNGNKYNGGSGSAYGATFTNGDIIGVALDLDAGTLVFYKNNTSQGTAFTGLSGTFTALIYDGTSASTPTYTANFGQRPFSYTPPTGFYPLNTYNLPTPTILEGGEYMNVVTWTGTGTSSGRSITGVGFQPDFVWGKPRSLAYTHSLSDAVRGANKRLNSGSTSAEDTNFQYGYTSSFDTDGFTTTSGSSSNENWNTTNETFVAWNWKASNAAGVSNTQGTITSTVSANTTAGFSIVTYTGNGSNSTIGHGLGVAPSFIIAKARNSAQRWTVYTGALGNAYYGYLNETFAFDTANGSLRWNTAPTSSVFGVGTSVDVNNNTTTYVAYCFAQVAGYSAFGSYTGNGSSDGVFVYLGFRARYLMIKCSSSTGGWVLLDTARDPYNDVDNYLYANSSAADAGSSNVLDINANGFKIRNSWTDINGSGTTYIYAAFAENPFKIARAR